MARGFSDRADNRSDRVDYGDTQRGTYGRQQRNPSFETFKETYGGSDTAPVNVRGSKVRGFFERFGNVDYSNIMSPQQIQDLNLMAYGQFMDPYATNRTPQTVAEQYGIGRMLAPGTISVSRYGPTGANPELGVAARGLRPGMKTSQGIAQAYRQDLSPLDRVAGLGTTLALPGSGVFVDRGTQVMGVGSRVPVSARTGEALRPTRGGILDLLTGGQSDALIDAGSRFIDRVFKRSEEVQDTPQDKPMISDNISISPNLAGLSTLPTNSPYQQVAESTYSMPDVQTILRNIAPVINQGVMGKPINSTIPMDQGQLSIDVQPGFGNRERSIQFNYSRPLQDLGLGSLLG